jgi:hypothetical protein
MNTAHTKTEWQEGKVTDVELCSVATSVEHKEWRFKGLLEHKNIFEQWRAEVVPIKTVCFAK